MEASAAGHSEVVLKAMTQGGDPPGFQGWMSNDDMRQYLMAQAHPDRNPGFVLRDRELPAWSSLVVAPSVQFAERLLSSPSESVRENSCWIATALRGSRFNDLTVLRDRVGEWVEVELVLEPENRYDCNAVAGDYLGVRIGYLSAGVANIIRRDIERLNAAGYTLGVLAKVLSHGFKHPLQYVPTGALVLVPSARTLRADARYVAAMNDCG